MSIWFATDAARTIFPRYKATLTVAVVSKSLITGVAATLIDVSFLKSVILVLLSAVMTGAFAVVVTVLQGKASRNLGDRIDRIEERQISVAEQMNVDPTRPAVQSQQQAVRGD